MDKSLPANLYCCIHQELLLVSGFKVFPCGHYFCEKCIQAFDKNEIYWCPKCRQPMKGKDFNKLPRISGYSGKLLHVDKENTSLDFNILLKQVYINRAKTIRLLRFVADEVSQIELTTAGVKIGGSVTSIVGGGMFVVGAVLSLTGVGAVAGGPLMVAGAGIGGAGGLVAGGGVIGEAFAKKDRMASMNKHFSEDYFRSIQATIILDQAAENPQFSKKVGLTDVDCATMGSVFGNSFKLGAVSVNFARGLGLGLARGAVGIGMHVFGLALSAVFIPFDILQVLVSSIKIHTKSKSEVVNEIISTAANLENFFYRY